MKIAGDKGVDALVLLGCPAGQPYRIREDVSSHPGKYGGSVCVQHENFLFIYYPSEAVSGF